MIACVPPLDRSPAESPPPPTAALRSAGATASRVAPAIDMADEPGDPTVLARRPLHRAAARACAVVLPRLHAAFAFAGALLVLLPALLEPARAALAHWPALARLCEGYAALGTPARVHLALLALTWLARLAAAPMLPVGAAAAPGFDVIVARELYPRTRSEELAWWIDVVHAVVSTSLWLFMPFGTLAFIAGALAA
jgi:hypothetical protein